MLKRNLVKASLISPVLLLLFPLVTAMRGEPKNSFKDKPIYINWQKAEDLVFDSTNTVLSETGLVNAPKILLNKNASPYVKSFLIKEEESLENTKERSAYFFKMMDGIFTKYGLPTELRYLAVVESDLKTTATSRVGAKGLWQFMPQTARDLGLKVKYKYDERTYAYKSTVAAARYLKDLYAQFGDWLLVIAAYNCGPVPVSRAIKISGTKNFWALQYYLPKESRFHVKRFIGTHYYFEGKGSLVTMTRAETIKYQNAFDLYKSAIQCNESKKDSAIAAVIFNKF
jgi:membrane-bound lytic murein transglycosylase D